MIVAPAVDLREGRCVQLVGGVPEEERVSLPDPVAQARSWWDMGFKTLHVVDLDAALSLGENRSTIERIIESTEAIVQVGGGIRDRNAARETLARGADRIIIGTRAIDDTPWLAALALEHPHQITVAADIRDGVVLRRGWTESTGLPVHQLLDRLAPLPLAGVLCTDVSREGRMQGIDLPAAIDVIRGTTHPVWISGGITTLDELRALDGAGAAGAVLGMALYTGTLPPVAVAEEFGS
ncbi:MAG: 1-(5-phosphoribosyl)-5-[(5-phosphoribosylamino)methylideneamino] imidazole-4-carboxamide isomerase [Gemmatimonadetes bacterium]|nr:1-(5-phosphoribosyl)-5-[(5-phosphoribosylamino)methylideneamino] imidazole-4-carboxamide isomerase [Gemmatimonadota bacterium]NNM05292.1 1-(5-phosphoribosyl)-5-[(5-phosphoribosylamino)methylideneamino] imidazole-4-carboxamide isomerase [Gemmatimonadota bacterium]